MMEIKWNTQTLGTLGIKKKTPKHTHTRKHTHTTNIVCNDDEHNGNNNKKKHSKKKKELDRFMMMVIK